MTPYAADGWLMVPVLAGLLTVGAGVAVWALLDAHVRTWWENRHAGPHRRALNALDRIDRRARP